MKNTLLTPTLAKATPTLTRCLKITRQDGTQLGFTTFDKNLVIEGLTYTASNGFNPTDIESKKGEAYNLEISSLLSSTVTAQQLKTGTFDLADVIIFIVDYTNVPLNLSADPPNLLFLFTGFINKIKFTEDIYNIELLSKSDFLSGQSNWSTSKTCRYQFCDSKCGLTYSNYREEIEVQAPGYDNSEFTSNVSMWDDKYTGSILTWLTGNNQGQSSIVIKSNGQNFFTLDQFTNPIETGDRFEVWRQCDKVQTRCQQEYGNFDNFGGEPTLPGLDEYYSGEAQ